MKLKKTTNLVVILLILGLITSAFAWCVSEDWKLIVRMKGKVESLRRGTDKWRGIWESRMLQDGDQARTLGDSRAKIRLSDQTVVTLGADTTVEMIEYKVTDKSIATKLKLLSGKARINSGRLKGQDREIEVTTPNAVLAARGTEFYVEQDAAQGSGLDDREFPPFSDASPPTGDTRLLVFSDQVDVNIGSQTFTVFEGQSAIVTPGGVFLRNPAGFPPPVALVVPRGQEPSSQGQPQGDADLQQPPPQVSTGAVVGAPAPGFFPPPGGTPGASGGAPSQPGGVFLPAPGTGTLPIVIH